MEPYNKNKPTVSWKGMPTNLPELIERLNEAGIPFTTALKYFADNPEGNALETLNLASDEVVPFKYQVRSGDASPSSVVQEALMLAMPGHPRYKNGKLKVDKARTKEFINSLKEDPVLEGYAHDYPWSAHDYITWRQVRNDPKYKPFNDVWDDIIVTDDFKGSPKYSPEAEPYPTHQYAHGVWEDEKPMFPHKDPQYAAARYTPANVGTVYETSVPGPVPPGGSVPISKYNFTAGELDKYAVPNVGKFYQKDYPYNPYAPGGEYSRELSYQGISAGGHSKLMSLAREYERTMLDESMDYQVKLRKLNEIRNEMEVLEALDGLE